MKNLRLFFAIPLNEEFHDLCRSFIFSFPHHIRWVADENRHITILFIGAFPEHLVGELCEKVSHQVLSLKPFELIFDKFTFFPERRPTMIWGKFFVSKDFSKMTYLLDSVVKDICVTHDLLYQNHVHHENIPHITLKRLRKESEFLTDLPTDVNVHKKLNINHFCLYNSELLSAGSKYTLLHDFSLLR